MDLPDEAFVDAIQGKLLGYIRCTKAAVIPHMRQRGGVIVNITGTALQAVPLHTPGSPCNAAIQAISVHTRPLEMCCGLAAIKLRLLRALRGLGVCLHVIRDAWLI